MIWRNYVTVTLCIVAKCLMCCIVYMIVDWEKLSNLAENCQTNVCCDKHSAVYSLTVVLQEIRLLKVTSSALCTIACARVMHGRLRCRMASTSTVRWSDTRWSAERFMRRRRRPRSPCRGFAVLRALMSSTVLVAICSTNTCMCVAFCRRLCKT